MTHKYKINKSWEAIYSANEKVKQLAEDDENQSLKLKDFKQFSDYP